MTAGDSEFKHGYAKVNNRECTSTEKYIMLGEVLKQKKTSTGLIIRKRRKIMIKSPPKRVKKS